MSYLKQKQFSNFFLHRTCWKNNIRFSTYDSSSISKTSDSCVLFEQKKRTSCGFILGFISSFTNEFNVILHTVRIKEYDSLIIKNEKIINPFMFWGELTVPPVIVIAHIDQIIVKLAYNQQDGFHFFQFPNTVEST